MVKDVSFSEQQWFRQIRIWLLLLTVNVFVLYGFLQQVVMNEPVGTKPTSDLGVTIVTLFTVLISAALFMMRLDTIVDRSGIRYRFLPFHLSQKVIRWEDVEKAYIRKYNPIREYGGWGIRWGTFGKGNAFNVSGDVGLQLVLKNGRKLLIGTQRPYDLDRVIDQLGVKTTE
jgi:hypothetical protein